MRSLHWMLGIGILAGSAVLSACSGVDTGGTGGQSGATGTAGNDAGGGGTGGSSELAANIVNAASCSQADVQAAIDSANDGDTVKVPAGECTWTTAVKIGEIIWTTPATYKSKQITLQGAGIDKTIITIGDANTPNDTALSIITAEGKPVRITGFTFQSGVETSAREKMLGIRGAGEKWRIDHNKFYNPADGLAISAGGYGVIDHNVFNLNGSGEGVYVSGAGDSSWADALSLGTRKAVYMEDNTFSSISGSGAAAAFDAGNGARLVFRNNMVNDIHVTVHGSETTGRHRSAFSYEIYKNTFERLSTPSWWLVFSDRGGTGVIFNNTVTGNYRSFVHVQNFRSTDHYKFWGKCDGTNPYDKNDGVTYDSGAHTGNNGENILTSTGKNWTPDQWRGYSLHNTIKGWSSVITTNTKDTITVGRAIESWSGAYTWDIGDSFIILRAYPCLDQVGRSTGDLLSNWNPPLPEEWPQQALEPLYEWSNTLNGKNADIVSDSPHIQKNRDFYDIPDSSVGLLSARPLTCAPYEAYFAADKNTLYKCTATNTWTAYYTPYTYPHP